MFYRKNIGSKQKFARILGGILMILCGLLWLDATLLGILVASTGVMAVLTGIFGYCPACAMVGRQTSKD